MTEGRGLARLRIGQPLLEHFRLDGFDHDRHEAVIATAQLGALTAVEARFVGINLEPGFVDETRNGVFLHAENFVGSNDKPIEQRGFLQTGYAVVRWE